MEDDPRFMKITILEMPEEFRGWLTLTDPYSHIHIVPDQRRHVHAISTACWCEPFYAYTNPDTGREVWEHNQIH